MKTKWVINELIGFILSIVAAVACCALLMLEVGDFLNKFGYTVLLVLYSIGCLWLLARVAVALRVMKFDETGFTVYGLLGKIGFCSWQSIEKAEYFYPKQVYSDDNDIAEYRLSGRIILIYNNEHYVTPEVNENGKVYNRDIKGRRLYLNSKNHIAWAMTNVASFRTFKKYFAHYRSDLFIERHANTIYND